MNIISSVFNWFSPREQWLIHLLPNEIITLTIKFISFTELINFYDALVIHSKIKQQELQENCKKLFDLVKMELSSRNYYKLLLNHLEEETFKNNVKNFQILKTIDESKPHYGNTIMAINSKRIKSKSFFQNMFGSKNDISDYNEINNTKIKNGQFLFSNETFFCDDSIFYCLNIIDIKNNVNKKDCRIIKITHTCHCKKIDNKKICPCRQLALEKIYGKANYYNTEKYCLVFGNTNSEIDSSIFNYIFGRFKYDLKNDIYSNVC